AIRVLAAPATPEGSRILGLIHWKALQRPEEALVHLERGPLHDPPAMVELDQLYEQLGRMDDRAKLLSRATSHRRIIERRADLALAQHRPAEALRVLESTAWPLEHQRYVRTRLWQGAREALSLPAAPVPEELGEDDLAEFGA